MCEGIEGGLADLGVGRAIDGPKRLRDVLAILSSGKIHGMADQVNDAGLNDRLRENRIDGFRKALQAIDDRDQNVLGAALLLCLPSLWPHTQNS